ETLASLAPKSVTSPLAVGIAEKIGGDPALAAAIVVLTGVLGAPVVEVALKKSGLTDPRALGLALGAATHGVGTAQALRRGETEGAFAAVGLCFMGFFTAFWAPLLLAWFG